MSQTFDDFRVHCPSMLEHPERNVPLESHFTASTALGFGLALLVGCGNQHPLPCAPGGQSAPSRHITGIIVAGPNASEKTAIDLMKETLKRRK